MENIFEKISVFRSLGGSVQIYNNEIAHMDAQLAEIEKQKTIILENKKSREKELEENKKSLEKVIDEINIFLQNKKENIEKFSGEILELEKKGFFDENSQNYLREKFVEEEKKYNDFNYILELFGSSERLQKPQRNFIFISKN